MDYTWKDVDNLYSKGLIKAAERSRLRGEILQEQNQFSGIHTKFVNNLVEDFQKGWADLVVGIKGVGKEFTDKKPEYSGFFLAPAAVSAWHAFTLLTLSPVVTAAGHAYGETLQDQYLKKGINNDTVNVMAAMGDAVTQLLSGAAVGEAVNRAFGVIPKAVDLLKRVQDDPAILARLNAMIPASVAKKAEAIVAQRDAAAAAQHAENLAPKVKEARAAMSAEAKRAAQYEEQKLADKAANRAAAVQVKSEIAGDEAANRVLEHQAVRDLNLTKAEQENIIQEVNQQIEARLAAEQVRLKAVDETHDLLSKAMTQSVPELSETRRTLDAAQALLTGGSSAEQVMTAAAARRLERSADNLLERNSAEFFGVNPRLIKKLRDAGKTDDEIRVIITPHGGAPVGYDHYLNAVKKSQTRYDENKALLDAGKINLDETLQQSSWLGQTKQDVGNITPGQAVDPHVLQANALAIKPAQKEIFDLWNQAGIDWANGNKDTFWRAMAETHALREIDPNYRMPLQTAGQTLRAAGKPVVSDVTRYQDKIVENGSWLAGENLTTLNEVEANALNIMRRMQAMGDPEHVGNIARGINTMAETVERDPTFRDKASFLFVNNIMSPTDTIGRNIFGNAIAAPWHYAEKITGIAAAKALNPFLSAKHNIEAGYATEANTFISTWASTMWDASRYMMTKNWKALEEMVPPSAREGLFANRYNLPVFSTTGTTNPFTGTAGQVIGTPTKFAQLADEVARIALYRGTVSERLMHEWRATGSTMPWQEYADRAFRNIPADMHEYGMRMAGLMTYSDDMSAFGRILQFARKNLPGAEFVQPFVHTFDRLTAYQYNRTPGLSLLSTKTWQELNSGDPLIRQEMAGRLFLSNIAGAGLFLLAKTAAPDGESMLTGGGPVDRHLATSLKNAGAIHPYTLWTPFGRMPYRLFAPISGPLGMIADTAEIWDQMRTEDATSIFTGIALAGSRTFFDNTYSGLFGLVTNLADNPTDQGIERYIRQQGVSIARGMIPFSGLIAQGMRAYDPTVKEIRSDLSIQDPLTRELYAAWWEFTRPVPGYGAPPKINPRTGEPVRTPPRLLEGTPGGWFLPTAPIQSEDDSVAKKFFELKMPFPDTPKAYGGANPAASSFAYAGPLGPAKEAGAGIPYSLEQENKLKRYVHMPDEMGQTADQEVKELLADSEFHKQSEVVQQEQIYAVYHRRIGSAVRKVAEEHPELDQQLELKRQLRGELRMNPDERSGFIAEQSSSPPAPQTENFIDFGNPQIGPAPEAPQ